MATPFEPQVPLPTPGLAGTSSSHLEKQKNLLVSCPHLHGVHILRLLMMTWFQMWAWLTLHLTRKEGGAGVTEVAGAATALMDLTPLNPLPLVEGEGRRRMGFLAKSKFQSLVERRAI